MTEPERETFRDVLPEREREIFLRRVSGETIKKTSEDLGLEPLRVRSLYQQALERIAGMLK